METAYRQHNTRTS